MEIVEISMATPPPPSQVMDQWTRSALRFELLHGRGRYCCTCRAYQTNNRLGLHLLIVLCSVTPPSLSKEGSKQASNEDQTTSAVGSSA